MAQLGQFDLQLAFVSAGALGEDIEDKAGPVHDPALEQTLQVALLGRGQGMVEDDHVGVQHLDLGRDLFRLAAADKNLALGALRLVVITPSALTPAELTSILSSSRSSRSPSSLKLTCTRTACSPAS
jgi:hypothetical protein